ncbi:hypothetical protein COT94_02200 [Candidatus Falkowbacteria bacterium CG10_big_fil_rev_8_21_14_0_10_37_14]|uniref:Uncharacterized protein n=1 Tax=Candidatus Falkowbacteria bacterium CG10_big_fil_rev_8_21_14_0_10_37_14 TaxID=1974561 RepID=A0A2M6WTD6_9BACT|nr:hypothetical protein [Candidatus Falkowbacteria bacterium]PIT96053.1 MAG: hypothetical protein COT94_02200 [Candidatus Falkowbacteria bacterium CG10_big_fil_rev_8_21_14_0_10_37_14]
MIKIISNLIFGLIVSGTGLGMIIKTEAFLSFFGRMEWFERFANIEGGSRSGYKFLGMIFIFVGVLIAFGMISGFIEWIISPLTKYKLT